MSSTLESLPDEVLKEILALKQAEVRIATREKAQNHFMPFVHHVYENFIEGRHHRVIAEKLEKIATGELKWLIVNMPPRHSKSEFASYLMPAWFLGRNPKQQDAGVQKQGASILLLESVQRSLVAVRTCLSLTTLIRNKMPLVKERLTTLMSGIRQALANVYSRVARLFS